jgi:hypothetical protein
MEPDRLKAPAGLGLVSMKECIRLVAGALEIGSQPNQGTTIAVRNALRVCHPSTQGAAKHDDNGIASGPAAPGRAAGLALARRVHLSAACSAGASVSTDYGTSIVRISHTGVTSGRQRTNSVAPAIIEA